MLFRAKYGLDLPNAGRGDDPMIISLLPEAGPEE
jgi:hypothetical protein